MKRRIIICILLAAVAVGGNAIRALAAADEQREMGGWGPGPADMMPPPPDGMIDHMSRQLKLTNDQLAKIKTLLAADREKAMPLVKKMAECRKQLHEAGQAEKFNEAEVRAIAAKQAQAEAELIVSRERVRSRINALLTPEQRSLAERLPPPPPRHRGQEPGGRYGCEQMSGHMPPPPPWDGGGRPGPGGEEGRRQAPGPDNQW